MRVDSSAELGQTEAAEGADIQGIRTEIAVLSSLVRQVPAPGGDRAKLIADRVDLMFSSLVERVSTESEITDAMAARRTIVIDLVTWMRRETKLWALDGAQVVRDRIVADLECLSDAVTSYLELESGPEQRPQLRGA